MVEYHYSAIKENHLGVSIYGVAWGETIKKALKCISIINDCKIKMICILSQKEVLDEDVPKFLLKHCKRETMMDLFE